MTTEGTQQSEPQTEPTAQQQQAQQSAAPQLSEDELKKYANEQLRSHAESVAEENKELRKLAMRSALGEIGLTPDEGLGLAIVESYQGQITDEGVAQYAAEKYKHGAQQPSQPQSPQVETAQRLDQLDSQSQPVTPTPQTTQGQQAVQQVDGNDPEADRQAAAISTTEKANEFLRSHYPNLVQQ